MTLKAPLIKDLQALAMEILPTLMAKIVSGREDQKDIYSFFQMKANY